MKETKMGKINVDEMTIGELKQIQALVNCGTAPTSQVKAHPYQVGKAYLIRTVTHYYTGRVVSVYAGELVLESAAWVADTGRYYDALKTGKLNEVEPITGPCIIGRGAIVDVNEWNHELPQVQK
jgi:hypothetical protein